jgi:hypothetical protein
MFSLADYLPRIYCMVDKCIHHVRELRKEVMENTTCTDHVAQTLSSVEGKLKDIAATGRQGEETPTQLSSRSESEREASMTRPSSPARKAERSQRFPFDSINEFSKFFSNKMNWPEAESHLLVVMDTEPNLSYPKLPTLFFTTFLTTAQLAKMKYGTPQ